MLYAWIFWQARLYANAVLQVVYLVLIVYGWYEWLHGGARGGELPVSKTPLWGWVATIGVGALVTAAAAWSMTRYTDASMPISDAATTAFSIVAEAMTARKWIENWILWIAIDAWTTWMLVTQKLFASAALYAVFVPLAVYGWMKWRRSFASA